MMSAWITLYWPQATLIKGHPCISLQFIDRPSTMWWSIFLWWLGWWGKSERRLRRLMRWAWSFYPNWKILEGPTHSLPSVGTTYYARTQYANDRCELILPHWWDSFLLFSAVQCCHKTASLLIHGLSCSHRWQWPLVIIRGVASQDELELSRVRHFWMAEPKTDTLPNQPMAANPMSAIRLAYSERLENTALAMAKGMSGAGSSRESVQLELKFLPWLEPQK